ncbi:MAG: hypothetical protein ACE5H4_15695 [Candidatus Thorarchaeota archaeon]
MIGEGSERGRRGQEGHRETQDEEEIRRQVREIIDEIERELAEEAQDRSEVKEEERVEEPEESVRDAVRELEDEEAERETARKEYHEREREKEESLERARQERVERADKDTLEEFEQDVLENLKEYGIDPEDVKEQWRKRFAKEVKEHLEGTSEEKQHGEDEEGDEGAGQQGATGDYSYFADGSQTYAVKTDGNEQTSAETETESTDDTLEEPVRSPEVPSQQESGETEEERPEQGSDVRERKRNTKEREEDLGEDQGERVDSRPNEAQEKPVEGPSESSLEDSQGTQENVERVHRTEKQRGQDQESETSREMTAENDAEASEVTMQEDQDKEKSEELNEWAEFYNREEESWRRKLRERFQELPEEEKERFRELLRELLKDEDDVEELARRNDLESLLDDEKAMEEIREYLSLKKELEEEQVDENDLEKLTEQLDESLPESLRELLSREGDLFWREILRNYVESYYPRSAEELEDAENNPELKQMMYFDQRLEDAKAWVEIMAMRRRGELDTIIRNGSERYRLDQIRNLSLRYKIPETEIIRWLRGEEVPPLVEGIAAKEMEKRRAGLAYGHLIDAYGEMYFYLRDEATFEKYIQDVGKALGIRGTRRIIRHLEKLAPQLICGKGPHIQKQYLRVKGEYLYVLNGLSGKSLADLEGQISKLTKRSGKGGIKNPKFPTGIKLEIALARLIATAVSDCHLKPNGTLEYFEPEISRIRLVEENLRVFGDINLNPKLVKRDNVYVSYFPAPIGMMLQHWGMPPGDRTIQNPGLFPWFHYFSWEALCSFFEDLIPQDGSVGNGYISWTHSNALHPGDKAHRYDVRPKVGGREIAVIKKHGNKERNCWALSLGKLLEIEESGTSEDSEAATVLLRILYENPNRLIEDGKRTAEKLRIKVAIRPATVRYHRRSGRVSVAWTAHAKGILQTVKMAIIAPPNDMKKRQVLRKLLGCKPKIVKQAKEELADIGVDIEEWWK